MNMDSFILPTMAMKTGTERESECVHNFSRRLLETERQRKVVNSWSPRLECISEAVAAPLVRSRSHSFCQDSPDCLFYAATNVGNAGRQVIRSTGEVKFLTGEKSIERLKKLSSEYGSSIHVKLDFSDGVSAFQESCKLLQAVTLDYGLQVLNHICVDGVTNVPSPGVLDERRALQGTIGFANGVCITGFSRLATKRIQKLDDIGSRLQVFTTVHLTSDFACDYRDLYQLLGTFLFSPSPSTPPAPQAGVPSPPPQDTVISKGRKLNDVWCHIFN